MIVVSILSCLVAIVLNYGAVMVLPAKVSEMTLWLLIVGGICLLLVTDALWPYLPTTNLLAGQLRETAWLLVTVALMSRGSRLMVDLQVWFHLNYNKENVHRPPLQWLLRNQETIKRAFMWFWACAPAFFLVQVWF
ncbi:hypothetical protein F0P96_05180 [Hymenobacter busanensis]|uniref:Uncharacterized protein n=1 Tax=Hymenobacter busanensis TaxID=2607656 RepID=A0AA88FJ69_9BACT|nr:hypothetical protein F0P96_05180 [Hymenobacter busanensis]